MKKKQNVVIRQATHADGEVVAECAQRAYAIYVDRIGRKPAPMVADFASHIHKQQVVVLQVSSGVVAYAIFFAQQPALFLENIAVHPDHHGSGFGHLLLEHVEQAARAGGYESVELYTNEKMTENLYWYPRHGYVEVARRSEDGFNRVYFRKNIQQQD